MNLPQDWGYQIIKQVGNYGEIFNRTVGMNSPLKIDRGHSIILVDLISDIYEELAVATKFNELTQQCHCLCYKTIIITEN